MEGPPPESKSFLDFAILCRICRVIIPSHRCDLMCKDPWWEITARVPSCSTNHFPKYHKRYESELGCMNVTYQQWFITDCCEPDQTWVNVHLLCKVFKNYNVQKRLISGWWLLHSTRDGLSFQVWWFVVSMVISGHYFMSNFLTVFLHTYPFYQGSTVYWLMVLKHTWTNLFSLFIFKLFLQWLHNPVWQVKGYGTVSIDILPISK